VFDAKILNQLLSSQTNLLTIKERYSFNQIVEKFTKSKKRDFVFVLKPKPSQMAALLILKLAGHKFYWIQAFSNPPKPNIVSRLLMNQSDTILVKSRKVAASLRSLGVEKPKMKLI